MADQEKDRQIDEMLDSLLTHYSSAEPRPGLEARILANLRDAEEKEAAHGWWNFRWLWAGVVTAAVIVAAVMINGLHRIAPPANVVVRTSQPAPQEGIQSHAPAVRNETVRIRPRKPLASTRPQNATLGLNHRPSVFPTPTPLSEQEKLLLSYLAGTPREEVVAQSHPDDPPVAGDQDQTEAVPDLTHIPQKFGNTR